MSLDFTSIGGSKPPMVVGLGVGSAHAEDKTVHRNQIGEDNGKASSLTDSDSSKRRLRNASNIFRPRNQPAEHHGRYFFLPYFKSEELNDDLRSYFHKRIAHRDPIYSILLLSLLSIVNFSKFVVFLVNFDDVRDSVISLAAALCALGVLTSVLYLLSFLTIFPIVSTASRFFPDMYTLRHFHLFAAMTVNAFGNALHLLARAISGPCESHQLFYTCVPNERELPSIHLVSVMLSPVILYLMCSRLVPFIPLFSFWTLITTLVCVCARVVRDSLYSASLFGICVVIMGALLISANDMLDSLEYTKALRSSLEKLTQSQMSHCEQQLCLFRSSLLHMANGLKTPLHSFAAGTFSMREVVSASSAKGNCSKSVAANLIDICIEMDACSAILSMQINRALDVCEAMRPGGRLKPRYESVSFDACLVWGLNVMASLQSKVSIRVLPYPTELSSGAHIITDKVWLMENFLCLLSNAVKYSLEDSIVTVKISIKNYHSVRSFYSDSSDDSAEVRLGPSFPPDPKDKDRKSVYTVAEATEKLSASMKAPAMHLDEHEEDGAVERDSTPAAIRNFHESSRPKLLLIEVHDGGIGIPREKRNLLFRPFIQSDSQRRSGGGTGMGLYSVALRIAELGGKFGMRSARGSETESSSRSSSSTMTSTISTSPSIAAAEASNPQGAYEVKIPKHPRGSVFYFAIPFVEDADLLSDAPPSVRPRFKAGHPSSNASSSTSGSGSLNSNSTSSSRRLLERLETERVRYDLGDVPTVLLVDDSAPNLTLLTRAFQQEGLQVHTASDGVSALKRMQEGVYTLVLLDIQMPIMDGIECVKQLREWENKSNCPPSKIQYIVGTSASSIAAMDATACGMDDFTMKPFEVKLVTEKVWSQRRRRRVQQQLLADAEKLSISQHLHYLTPNLLKDHQVSVMSTQIAGNPGAGNSVCSSTTTSSSSKSSGKRKKRKVSSIDSSSQPSASTGSAPLPPLSPIFSREERGLLDQTAEITSVIPPSPRLSPLVISGTVKSSFSSVSPVDSDYSPPGDDEVK